MKTTREAREAFAREYWPDGPKPGTHGHSWLHGHVNHGAWDAAARAIERETKSAMRDSSLVIPAAGELLIRACAAVGPGRILVIGDIGHGGCFFHAGPDYQLECFLMFEAALAFMRIGS